MNRLLLAIAFAGALAADEGGTTPSPQQIAWQDLEIGALIHFGPNTFMDREWGDGTADPSVFNPTQCDPEQWVLAAKAGGVKYLIMVAKHHDGFALWPSQQTDYSVKSSPWRNGKGDLVREVATAARKHGLKFGVYLSPWDRHEPKYKDNQEYDRFYLRQLTELVSHYGELVEFWLDGAGSAGHIYDFEAYLKELRTYQPNTLVFADTGFLKYGDIRWVGNESGEALEDNWNVVDRLGYLRYRPVEADTPLRDKHWFWHPNDEASVKSVDKLLEIYHRTVGRGAQLVLGLAPDNRGLLPDSDVARLKEFGDALRRIYGNNLAAKAQKSSEVERAVDNDPDTFWMPAAGQRATTLHLEFPQPVSFDRTVAMEWLEEGQQIRKYTVEIREGNAWREVVRGTSVGHRKIDIFPRVTASGVRLRILSAAGPIRLREFQVFDGSGK